MKVAGYFIPFMTHIPTEVANFASDHPSWDEFEPPKI